MRHRCEKFSFQLKTQSITQRPACFKSPGGVVRHAEGSCLQPILVSQHAAHMALTLTWGSHFNRAYAHMGRAAHIALTYGADTHMGY